MIIANRLLSSPKGKHAHGVSSAASWRRLRASRRWPVVWACALILPQAASLFADAPQLSGEEARLLESKVAPWIAGDLALRRALKADGPLAERLAQFGTRCLSFRPLRGEAGSGDEDSRPVLALLPAKQGRALEIDVERLAGSGAKVLRRTPDLVLARLPLESIPCVASDPAIGFIRPPLRPSLFWDPVLDREELDATGATAWHSSGLTAAGVKVGVLDVEYGFYRDIFEQIGLKDYEKWAPDGVTFGGEEDGPHGTGCTEVLHYMAPGASFYLAQLGPESMEADYEKAFEWMADRGASVVSSSIGLMGWFYDDGTSPFAKAVDKARDRGLFVCMAAGNHAQGYFWAEDFKDGDGNGLHEFEGKDEGDDFVLGPLSIGFITLTWDGGQSTSEDFDLLICPAGGKDPVAQSSVRQAGAQPSLEAIVIMTPLIAEVLPFFPTPYPSVQSILDPGGYEIRVQKVNAAGAHGMRLFTDMVDFEWYAQLSPQYTGPAHSLSTPSDARGSFTVGAIDLPGWQDGIIAEYSSQGPTGDGRVKPDIAGPSALDTVAYAGEAFRGTSAATPVCAGAASLVLGRYSEWGPDKLGDFLRQHAIDAGAPGPDSVFGAGKLHLPSPSELEPTFRRGEVDGSATMNLTDAVYLLNYLFLGGEPPTCLDAADTDDDGSLQINDAIRILRHLFQGGDPPAAPFESCGADPTVDELGCASFGSCG